MLTIEAKVIITKDGKLKIDLPTNLPPGEHRIVIVVEENLLTSTLSTTATASPNNLADFPVIDIGGWSDELPMRREELYDDNGR